MTCQIQEFECQMMQRPKPLQSSGPGKGNYEGGFFMLEEVAEAMFLQWKRMMWCDRLWRSEWLVVVMGPVSSPL